MAPLNWKEYKEVERIVRQRMQSLREENHASMQEKVVSAGKCYADTDLYHYSQKEKLLILRQARERLNAVKIMLHESGFCLAEADVEDAAMRIDDEIEEMST